MDLSMYFTKETCIQCGSGELTPIVWLNRKGIPHGYDGHSIAHSYVVVIMCNKCKGSQLECFDYDGFYSPEEPDMYWWYALNPEHTQRLLNLLDRCPGLLSPECNCSVHQSLRESKKGLFSVVRPTYNNCEKALFCWLSISEKDGLPYLHLDESKEPEETA